MDDYFNFLPTENEGIIFLDTCAFDTKITNRERTDTIRELYFVKRLEKNTKRLAILTPKLRDMNNWITIPEVIEEFKEGIDGLVKVIPKIANSKIREVVNKAISQKQNTYGLMKDNYEKNTRRLLAEMLEIRDSPLLQSIKSVFLGFGGKIDKRNTDCKIIDAALSSAKLSHSYVFSEDGFLLRTYSWCSVKLNLPLKGTLILDEYSGHVISTQQHYLDHKLYEYEFDLN